jgi:hypothetical protein
MNLHASFSNPKQVCDLVARSTQEFPASPESSQPQRGTNYTFKSQQSPQFRGPWVSHPPRIDASEIDDGIVVEGDTVGGGMRAAMGPHALRRCDGLGRDERGRQVARCFDHFVRRC